MNPNANLSAIGAIQSLLQTSAGQSGSSDAHQRQEAEAQARYRLIIEEGPQKGSFVYKTLDRVTGEVVRQLPREEVVRLMDDDNYGSGSVIDTQA